MPTREWIGLQLRKARQPRKQEEVAAAFREMGLPMSQNRLSRLERGETDMTPDELVAFCRLFSVTPDYFLFDADDARRLTGDRVLEDKAGYNRLLRKLDDLTAEDLELIERLVDQLKKK